MRRTQTNKQGKKQMGKRTRRHLYRMFCMVSLVIAVYLVADLIISGTLNLKVILVFILFLTAIIWGTINQKLNEEEIRNQERELKLYQLYIQPLEELVKEIRVRQHEFDNHINAKHSLVTYAAKRGKYLCCFSRVSDTPSSRNAKICRTISEK